MKALANQMNESAAPANTFRLSRNVKQLLSTATGFVVLCFVFSMLNENFASINNILNVAVQVTPILLIAMGQTYVLITGGIDLSIGSNIGFGGVVAGMLMVSGTPIILAVILGLLAGALVGALNGALIVYGNLPPFIVTLGTMTSVRGLTLTLTKGIPVSNLPQGFNQIGLGSFLGIPVPVYIMVAYALIFGFILAKTKTGRYTYAIGSNFDATRLSGVNTSKALIKVYIISGFLAATAGLIMAARIISSPPMAGDGYELDAVAASVIGGTSTMGGEGTIAGTVIGAFIIAVLRNGLNLAGISPFIQKIVIGAVIVAAVLFDRIKRKD